MKIYKASISELSDEAFETALSLMSEERKSAVLRYRSETDRKRTVLGEILARRAISEHCGVAQSEIEFKRTEKGKPFAVGLSVGFNVSHSENTVICAVSDKNVGADVEVIRPINMKITRVACNESDLLYLFGDNLQNTESVETDRETLKRFFEIWTAKEAYFKYTGSGIADMKSLSYNELRPFCVCEYDGECIITVYSPNES